MKTLKITTNRNCQGSYDEVVLAAGHIKTTGQLTSILQQAGKKFNSFRKLSPNYPFFIFVNGEKMAELDAVMLISDASLDPNLRDIPALEKFLRSE